MNIRLLGILVLVAAIGIAGFFALNVYIYEEKQAYAAEDFKDAEYVIAGERFLLQDGMHEKEVTPGSASKVITKYFGNEVRTDLDGDGREDVAFILTQEMAGTGMFYYVVGALNTRRGYVGSEALFLGDRIAPQTTEVSRNPQHKNVIVVNYADRAPGEPYTTAPSVGKSLYLKLDPQSMQFGEVVADFEGEADPKKMSLTMKTWEWVSALYGDGREIRPKAPGIFTVSFGMDGKFTATTDCNSVGGSYKATGDTVTFSDIYMTKKFCQGSQELDFTRLLENTFGYHFTSKGELIVDLKFDSGTVTFR